MILVDTAVWIDHLHRTEPKLVDLLGLDRVGGHPLIVEEIALGSIRERDHVLSLLSNLYQFPVIGHQEILHITNQRRLWERGLSPVDVHLMAAVALVSGSQLWTRDKRLKSACDDTGISLFVQN
ncbi:MAG: type II toxin-antitoxin system VapC family toxin [Mycobacterium sp.]|nr:type II toxin-antitoxin system VapC family toxin [Mycobacterium sp.]